MTRFDAETLLREKRGDAPGDDDRRRRRDRPRTRQGLTPFQVDARYTTADFFPMFDVPFRYGSGWTRGRGRSARRAWR